MIVSGSVSRFQSRVADELGSELEETNRSHWGGKLRSHVIHRAILAQAGRLDIAL